METEFSPDDLQDMAIRKLLADELISLRCNGVARNVASGYDRNPRTLAAIDMARKMLGIPSKIPTPPADRK